MQPYFGSCHVFVIVVSWVKYLIVRSVKAHHLPFVRYTSKFPYESCTDSKFLSIGVVKATVLGNVVKIIVGIIIVNGTGNVVNCRAVRDIIIVI